MQKRLCLLLVLLSLSHALWAQVRVSGTVTGRTDGKPIPGVTILEVGTNNGTTTDINGGFALTSPPNATLRFSFVGMKPYDLNVKGLTSPVSVSLEEDPAQLSEVVVTGYKEERRRDLTGAVAVVNLKQTLQESNANILSSLQGRVPGVVIQSDGTPGGSGTAIRIRGFSTIGANGPLFVIDGVPTTYSGALNPNDIESIQVLKDAAAASIYGSRASNGVIVVTTKRASSPEPKITFDTFYGVQTLRNRIEMLNANEWGQVYWQAQRNSGLTPSHPQYGNGAQPVIPPFIDAENTIPASNTDWLGAVFKPSQIQSYNLGLSMGGTKGKLYTGLNYVRDNGIQQYTNYNRLTLRLNSDYTVKNRLTIGENLQVARFGEVKANVTHDAIFQHPLIPLYDNAGNFGGPTDGLGDKLNPLGILSRNRDNQSRNWRILGNVYAQLNLMKGLNLRTSYGVDYNNGYARNFEPRFKEGRFNIVENFLTTAYSEGLVGTWSNTLNFQKTVGEAHNIGFLAGVEAIQSQSESFSARRKNFLVQDYDYAYLGAGTDLQAADGGGSRYSLLSQFGKLDYSYREKYLFSATIRRDGSSRFGANNKYGVFPAFSAGWRISDESFLKDNRYVSDLKLRASWGRTGNQEIGDFTTLNFYRTSGEFGNYDLGGGNTSAVPGYYTVQIGNNNLRWESNTQTNIGLDASLFNGKLSLTADYFDKRTDGMLINPTLLAVYGQGAPPFINAGQMRNRGFEALVTYRGNVRDFSYSVDLNASTYRNQVLSLGEGNEFFLGAEANRIVPGQPLSVFYGWVADGLFRSQADVDAHATQPGKAPGRIRYKDLNGDGTINDQDRTYIGNPHPKLLAGMNLSAQYKGFDVSVFASGTFGNDVYNTFRKLTDFAYFPFNFGRQTLNAWTPENPGASVPAVNINNPNDELRASSYFVENGSFVNLKSLVLGYTLPAPVTKRLNIDRLRLYVQGQNLFIITNYQGMDPEVGARGPLDLGVDTQLYPHSRAINFGLNLAF
ncbi:TonB-dependent receptor [Spirosoma sp. 209]|uniref:SusC/RagA family TonB-linked outer membrane protein n=1 Tax=Spirosoma sp. 209 TaxID=1955701 RepID=UPI00098D2B29|nr:TonB-dependent receptor [Spirosoma sp. 209]